MDNKRYKIKCIEKGERSGRSWGGYEYDQNTKEKSQKSHEYFLKYMQSGLILIIFLLLLLMMMSFYIFALVHIILKSNMNMHNFIK